MVSISFALFSPSINLLGRRNIKISKCELDINFKESDELMLVSKYPIKDSEALKLKAKDVVITNNSTCDTAYYKLTIKDLNNSSINKSKIKFQLVDKSSGDTTNGSDPDTFLVEDSLTKGDSKSYEIKLWIDESATNTDLFVNGDTTKPIEYKYALNLEASDGSLAPNLDTSGANKPALTSNMIPVYYDSTSNVWKKADKNNSDASNQWYDYDNKMWANEVTVTSTNRDAYLNASAGTEIPMDDINTMWVWIPRYTYTYLNTNTPQSINIKFEEGTASSGTIKCTDAVTGTSSTSETCTDTTNNGLVAGTSTYTHPAFWWDKNDNNVREEGEELTGIWVGKFEVSSDTSCTASSKVAVGSGCNLQTIRPQIKPNVTSWRGAQVGTFFNGIQKMRESGNKYGFSTTDETHMMKNMEWGAVTYLSHSKYGINKEITVNNCSNYITGIGADTVSANESSTTCTTDKNKYNGTSGVNASTTGNVYGVYDMSGGSWEYMMGNMVWSNGQQTSGNSTANNYNSAFAGYLGNDKTTFTGTYAFPNKRYYDKYSYGTSNTEYTREKLGDATKEMVPTGTSGNWYSDYASFPSAYNPWFLRGGFYSNDANAGAFSFSPSSGYAAAHFSARAVLPGALD